MQSCADCCTVAACPVRFVNLLWLFRPDTLWPGPGENPAIFGCLEVQKNFPIFLVTHGVRCTVITNNRCAARGAPLYLYNFYLPHTSHDAARFRRGLNWSAVTAPAAARNHQSVQRAERAARVRRGGCARQPEPPSADRRAERACTPQRIQDLTLPCTDESSSRITHSTSLRLGIQCTSR